MRLHLRTECLGNGYNRRIKIVWSKLYGRKATSGHACGTPDSNLKAAGLNTSAVDQEYISVEGRVVVTLGILKNVKTVVPGSTRKSGAHEKRFK
jgi:hypothetical protein